MRQQSLFPHQCHRAALKRGGFAQRHGIVERRDRERLEMRNGAFGIVHGERDFYAFPRLACDGLAGKSRETPVPGVIRHDDGHVLVRRLADSGTDAKHAARYGGKGLTASVDWGQAGDAT